MIKENINITFTGGETSVEGEGQIIVPSQVVTSTPQNEDVDLEKAPNVLIKLKDEAARGVRSLSSEYKKINAEFELGDKTYTMNMSLIDSTQDYAVLQYCDGLTAEEVEHTFEATSPQIETSHDLISGDVQGATAQFLYDGTAAPAEDISFSSMNYHNITVGEPTPEDITLTPKSSFTEMSTGEFVDTLTATYKGMTATVTVTLTITEDYTTKIKCNTSKGQFLVYSTDSNDTIQTVQYDDYTDIGGEYRIPCSWSVETDNPDYQNLTDFQSDGGAPYNIDYLAPTFLNGTLTGQFGGWNENYVQMLEALSIRIEYVEPQH